MNIYGVGGVISLGEGIAVTPQLSPIRCSAVLFRKQEDTSELVQGDRITEDWSGV